jgi:hypothetical protein
VAISEFGVIKRGDKMREHCIWEKKSTQNSKPLYKGHLSMKGISEHSDASDQSDHIPSTTMK